MNKIESSIARGAPGSSGQANLLLTYSDWSDAEPSAACLDAFVEFVAQLPDQCALLDKSWKILALSEAWAREAAANGYPQFRVGANYIQICDALAKQGDRDAALIFSALARFAAGEIAQFECVYSPSGKPRGHYYRLRLRRFTVAGAGLALLSRTDVTDLLALTRQCHNLEETLIATQEVERRRMGRELHDTTAQLLVVLHLSLIRLKSFHTDKPTMAMLSELDDILAQINSGIRATSYLLHPPEMVKGGLAASINEMAQGFGRRAGLDVAFDSVGESEVLEPLAQRTLYRVTQEALANVHRHAHANRVKIRLVVTASDYVHLIIDDDGVGISPAVANVQETGGVGLSSMRARIRELGGRFSIRRLKSGTRVIASIALPKFDRL